MSRPTPRILPQMLNHCPLLTLMQNIESTKLLVSVRDAREAALALAAGVELDRPQGTSLRFARSPVARNRHRGQRSPSPASAPQRCLGRAKQIDAPSALELAQLFSVCQSWFIGWLEAASESRDRLRSWPAQCARGRVGADRGSVSRCSNLRRAHGSREDVLQLAPRCTLPIYAD